jgi:5-methylcytosine-specific restriction endonuclease McrA
MDIDAPVMCKACGKKKPLTHDHTISQKRCKELGYTELIYDEENIQYTCHDCHQEWESYKSGKFRQHKNFERRMEFLKVCDPEGWRKRMI